MNRSTNHPSPALAPTAPAASDRSSGPGRELLASLRPQQWVKNAFVIAPLVFSGTFLEPKRVILAGAAGAVFCVLASAGYLVNDLCDRRHDAAHPLKRHRRIASGRLSPGIAAVAAALLFAVGLGLGTVLLPGRAAALAGAYAGLSLLYSARLKHVIFLDAMALAAGFVLRVMVGGAAIDVPVSHWIILCTFLLALFLAFGKRRREVVELGDDERRRHRRVLDRYSVGLLDQINAALLGATIVGYTLYTVSEDTVARIGGHAMIWTVPFVVYGLFRYLALVHRDDEPLAGNPSEALLRDRPLLVAVLLWIVTSGVIVSLGTSR